jgi:hypothetical protein
MGVLWAIPMPLPPYLISVSLLVCERVLREMDGVLSAIRVVDIFYVPQKPPEIPAEMLPMVQAYAFASLWAIAGYQGKHSLSVRMTVRRFTRLTNAFSKKIENHAAAVALGYFAYNFIKVHRTLRTSPAMAAGITDRLWDVADLVTAWEMEEHAAERAA